MVRFPCDQKNKLEKKIRKVAINNTYEKNHNISQTPQQNQNKQIANFIVSLEQKKHKLVIRIVVLVYIRTWYTSFPLFSRLFMTAESTYKG